LIALKEKIEVRTCMTDNKFGKDICRNSIGNSLFAATFANALPKPTHVMMNPQSTLS